jgi:hypothetical protein
MYKDDQHTKKKLILVIVKVALIFIGGCGTLIFVNKTFFNFHLRRSQKP